jgi:hypothetical protein
MATAAVIARIVTQYSDKGSKAAAKDMAKLEKRINAFSKKAVKSFGLAATATAAFAVKVGVDAVKGAAADEKQQASLAIALRNTTLATDEAIAANAKYLDSLELQVAIDNEKLIPALQTLATATGDLGQAQDLLSLATDVSAASQKDLQTVAVAMSKALNGNFTALNKLGLPLDQAAIKAKDFTKIQKDLAQISRGQAAAAANTFAGRLEVLRLSFAQVADKLGYALMPLILDFTDYLVKPGGLLDSLDRWIETNEKELQKSLEGVTDLFKIIVSNGDTLAKTLNVLVTISTFLNGSILGVVKWGEALLGIVVLLKIVRSLRRFKIEFGLSRGSTGAITSVMKYKEAMLTIKSNAKSFAAAIGVITTAFRAQGVAAGFAAIATAFATAGVSVATAGTALAAVGVTALVTKNAWDMYSESQDKAAASAAALEKKLEGVSGRNTHPRMAAAARKQAAIDKAAADQRKKDAAAQAAANKLSEAAKKRAAAIDAKNAALRKSIQDKYKVSITNADEYENIQLTAVQKLQAKQKDADESLKERIKLRKEELALFTALSANAQRYTDLLAALADEKLSDNEISLLAKKWGLTVDAAKSYIYTIFAIKDEKVSEEEVDKLATAWGITKAQAGQYLDFFAALNDGKLSDTEIANLMKKWNLTKEEATKYADFISKIGDGKLDDKEIENLKSKWGLTTEQVVDYIKKIGGKVDATGTILSAGDIAALGWTNALNALNAYLAALKTSSGGVPTVTPPVVVPVVPKIDGTGLGGSKTDSAASSAKSTAAAAAYAAAKAAGDTAAAAIAAAGVTPSALASQESGAIGALSIANQLKAAEAAQAKAQRDALSNFRAAESLSAMNDAAASRDYDERFRFMGSSTLDTAKSIMGSGMSSSASTNVYVTVNGSVTTENDLVQTVRNGLLAAQTNGQGLTLQAI